MDGRPALRAVVTQASVKAAAPPHNCATATNSDMGVLFE